ncbi:hypothetical protein KHA90_11315 [Flavobacterium psychroterrae]|uniref:Phage tail protein n=1 Tax=Flavobacterium psychroterrae TaxID=2133767 RepID=A0ABS5PBF4_9FLAO|nr:hypothetical protein [Flavobacterium psychroterrae]MBS7231613.1 hypothetical protein [Flavobacterium psychroterrae]
MIQSNFIKIFGVAVYHSFYDNNKCNCLHFTPNAKTAKAFHKFGFKTNLVTNGFELFSNTKSSVSDFLDYILKTTHQDYFEFDINCSNPNFILFTALPINWLGEINYSSQDPKNQTNKDSIILNQTLETKPISKYFGNLKIYFDDIKKSTNSLLFEINFTARATQWQYYFINKNNIQLSDPSITEKENIQFNGPEKMTLQTGEQALLFTSGTTNILLSEKPKYKFDLVNKTTSNPSLPTNSKGKIIFKGLPVPDVSRIGIIENQHHQVTSPMYIYL